VVVFREVPVGGFEVADVAVLAGQEPQREMQLHLVVDPAPCLHGTQRRFQRGHELRRNQSM
jgi:hypothetical protein